MAVFVECPSRPPHTLYDEHVEVYGPGYDRMHLPEDPGPIAGRRAGERYQKLLAEHAALLAKQKATIMPPRPGPVFLCGEKVGQPAFCPCGHTAEMLCDYPMGEGKTCDLPLCWCCSKHIATDTDLCLIHFAEFVKKSGSSRINPWPPARE